MGEKTLSQEVCRWDNVPDKFHLNLLLQRVLALSNVEIKILSLLV